MRNRPSWYESKKAMRSALPVLLFLAAPFARAQFDPQISADAMYNAGIANVMYSTLEAQRGGSGKGRKTAVPTPARTGTRFIPSAARRKAQGARFLTAVTRANAGLGRSIAPAFKGDPVRFVAPTLSRYGLRSDDVADLGALYLAGAWYGANGKAGDPTRGEVRGIRNQLLRAFSGSTLRRASDSTKQNAGEGLLYLAFVNEALAATMRAHPEAKSKLMAEVAAGTKRTLGLDLRRLKLSSAGLRS